MFLMITEKHIIAAEYAKYLRGRGYYFPRFQTCAVSLAMAEATGAIKWEVFSSSLVGGDMIIRYSPTNSKPIVSTDRIFTASPALNNFIINTDNGYPVEPGLYEIELVNLV